MAWEERSQVPELPPPGELGIQHLRPFALRFLLVLLADDDAPVGLRLNAAKLVVERSHEPEKGASDAGGSDAVTDLEAERLWRELQKHA